MTPSLSAGGTGTVTADQILRYTNPGFARQQEMFKNLSKNPEIMKQKEKADERRHEVAATLDTVGQQVKQKVQTKKTNLSGNRPLFGG